MNGFVKTVVLDKGYGFIRADSKRDYFFHKNELMDGLRFENLVQGETRVEFEVDEHAPKGPRAINVKSSS